MDESSLAGRLVLALTGRLALADLAGKLAFTNLADLAFSFLPCKSGAEVANLLVCGTYGN